MKKFLAVDIGGTAVKLGIIDETGRIWKKDVKSVSFDNYQTPILDTVTRELHAFADAFIIEETGFEAIAVSATGQIDSQKGIVAGTCGNLPGWNGAQIRARLEKEFHLPVTVVNDANAMCLGEQWIGAAKGIADVIGITIGTGIGGGIISGGKLLEGARGLGGEIGHFMTHALDGQVCTCGQRGCYEHYAATSALVRNAREKNPQWTEGRAIFVAAKSGNREAQAVIDQWLKEIAAGLISLVHIFNPSLIIIGGGVSEQEELLIRPLEKIVKKSVMPAFADNLTIRAAQLKNDAGMIGAVYYALESNCGGRR